MNKAYIILVHKHPQQLLRLIKTLDDGLSVFFIHVDKNVSIKPFEIVDQLNTKIKFIDRVCSSWSTFGLVQSTLNGIKAVQAADLKFDRIILLSGQDYPIKSNHYINNYLKESAHSNFLEHTTLPDFERWAEDKGGMYRVNKYFFGLGKFQLFLSKSLNFSAYLFPFLGRKIPRNMKPYAGSQWWILDQYALNYVIDFVEKNPGYNKFHQNTFGSDELYFQMILLNSRDEKLLASIKNDNKRFIKWKSYATSHPELLSPEDLTEIKQSESLFARKFDSSVDLKILDLIDENCLHNYITT